MWWLEESFKIRPTPVAWEFYDLNKDPQEIINKYNDEKLQRYNSEIEERLEKSSARIK